MQEIKTKTTQLSWHNICIDSVLEKLGATSAGLNRNEAETRLKTHGPNRLPDPPKRSTTMQFLLQFHNILIYVLLGSAVITAVLDHWIDTLVILAVVLGSVDNLR